MKFQDPSNVNYPVCGKSSSRPLVALRERCAACPECGSSLDAISDRMQQLTDDWTAFWIVMTLALELEDRLKCSAFDDHDLKNVHSLADLAAVVENKIGGPDRQIAAVSAIHAAIIAKFPAVERPVFDGRLIDVFRPCFPRWSHQDQQ